MQSSSASFDQVWHALVRAHPVTASELAADTGLTVSTVSRHLNALARSGRAQRERRGKEVRYAPQRVIELGYTGPVDRDGMSWDQFEWLSHAAVDWRYPLVTRIPDEPAQQTLRSLIDLCDERGIFHPWLRHAEVLRDWVAGQPQEQQKELERRLAQRATWQCFEFVVYGSCARGDAREESDLDLLVIGPSEVEWDLSFGVLPVPPFIDWRAETLRAIDDVNLASPRVVDPIVREREQASKDRGVESLPRALKRVIFDEGQTVLTTSGRDLTIEGKRDR